MNVARKQKDIQNLNAGGEEYVIKHVVSVDDVL